MAQLKDTVISGDLRVTGTTYSSKINIPTDATIANGDKLLIRDVSDSDSIRSSSITFGTGTSTFLRNDGTWGTPPAGTVTSVQVQATSPVRSSTSTAQTGTLNTTISLADNYGDTKNPYASKTKNYVLAAPSSAAGAPSFRALVDADIPKTNSYSATGTTAITGTGVAAALGTLDSSITATTNQAISAITITDGKIASSSKISIPTAGTTATAVATSTSGGSATTWSKSDHKHSISSSTILSALGVSGTVLTTNNWSGTVYPSTNDTYYLGGLCGYATSSTVLRVQVPVLGGYTTSGATIELPTTKTFQVSYNGTSSTLTMTAVSVVDANPASLVIAITVSSGLTTDRSYGIKNGSLNIYLDR